MEEIESRPRPSSSRQPLALVLAVASGVAAAWIVAPPSIPRRWVAAVAIAVSAVWACALHLAQRRHERERRDLRARSESAERELRRSRDERRRLDVELNPHFVFSSLHAVSALMGRDAAGANRVLSLLGEVIRGALVRKEAADVALEDEIDALAPILEIENVRFGERLRIHWVVSDETLDARVPPRLLHALVELLIQHASVRAGAAREITVRADRAGPRLALTLTDPTVTALDLRPQPVGPGTDFVAVSSRLAQLFGDQHTLEIRVEPETGARIGLTLPWRDEDTTDPHPTSRS